MTRRKKIMMMPLPAAMASAPLQPLQPRVYCNYSRLPQAMTATGPSLPWTPHPHGMSPQHPLQMPAGGHGLQPHPLNSGFLPPDTTNPDPLSTHRATPISQNPFAGMCIDPRIKAQWLFILFLIGLAIGITVAVVGLPSSFSFGAKFGVFFAVFIVSTIVMCVTSIIFCFRR